MGGARRSGLPRPSQQVGTYSVIGKEFLQLLRWEPFIKAVGRLNLLPPSIATVLREAEQATAHYDALTLTIAIALWVCSMDNLKRPHDHLYTAGLPDVDLIIRTSGEIRLSGFLLWQSARSSDVNWPEFRRVDFFRAVRSFQERSRRFGQ